jgi:hypothetical protein
MQENLFWSEKNVECCDSPAIWHLNEELIYFQNQANFKNFLNAKKLNLAKNEQVDPHLKYKKKMTEYLIFFDKRPQNE